jgi:hypothetical protein
MTIEKWPKRSVAAVASVEPSEPLGLTETNLIAAALIPFCIAIPEMLTPNAAPLRLTVCEFVVALSVRTSLPVSEDPAGLAATVGSKVKTI